MFMFSRFTDICKDKIVNFFNFVNIVDYFFHLFFDILLCNIAFNGFIVCLKIWFIM